VYLIFHPIKYKDVEAEPQDLTSRLLTVAFEQDRAPVSSSFQRICPVPKSVHRIIDGVMNFYVDVFANQTPYHQGAA
jgi:hypothetical protein